MVHKVILPLSMFVLYLTDIFGDVVLESGKEHTDK